MSKGKPCRNGSDIHFTEAVRLLLGWASLVLSKGKIVSVEWESGNDSMDALLGKKYPGGKPITPIKSPAERFLREYSGGRVLTSRDIWALPIDWGSIPEFQRMVLKAAAAIPYGKTTTYGSLAAEIGRPGAGRAVGGALSRNPWPILIPCHRVIGASGKLTGFGKGLAAKETLLRFEAANIRRREVAQ